MENGLGKSTGGSRGLLVVMQAREIVFWAASLIVEMGKRVDYKLHGLNVNGLKMRE